MFRMFSFIVMVSLFSPMTAWAAGSGGGGASGGSAKNSPFSMGVKAVKAGDYSQAVGLFKQAAAKKPDNANTWNYLGFSYRKLRQMDQALAAYEKALALDPEHRGANEYLGELYVETGQMELARERLEKLDDICTFGCEEYDDLKEMIEARAG